MSMDVTPLKPYWCLYHTDTPYVVLYGGAGSGKSAAMCEHLLYRLMSEPTCRGLVVRATYKGNRLSTMEAFRTTAKRIGLYQYLKFTVSPMAITLDGTDRAILFLGLDREDKLKSLEGIEWVWVEEANEKGITWEKVLELKQRMRKQGDKPARLYLSFNPERQTHWTYDVFFAKKEQYASYWQNTTVVHSTYRDNPYLSEEFIREVEALEVTHPLRYRIYNLGEWGTLDKQVYQPFKMVKTMPDNPDVTFYGLDWGTNNPLALVKVCKKDNLLYIQELIYQRGMFTTDLIAKLKEFGVKSSDYIFVDPEDANRKMELLKANYMALNAKKDVMAGVDYLNGQWHRMYSLESNHNLHKEQAGYTYKRNAYGEYTDDPIKENDHALDALRYAIFTYHTITGN